MVPGALVFVLKTSPTPSVRPVSGCGSIPATPGHAHSCAAQAGAHRVWCGSA
ncbi:hypothetical protein D3M57_14850 [Klebsiella pneumoniae]|nr:hypothetical protein [Klebsiella pneumoniae]